MSRKVTAVEVARFLEQRDNYIILTHASPDGDTLGSGFALCSALREIGKKANVVCADEIPKKFQYLTVEPLDFEIRTVVSVDVADEKLLGDLRETYQGKIELSIDHHDTNKQYAELLYCDAKAAAACECIYRVICELQVNITPHIANCIYTGIATDTGCFKFSNTTAETHIIAAELIKLKADYAKINYALFEQKSCGRIAMERLVLERLELFFDNKVAVITITEEMLQSTDCDRSEFDSITAIPRQIEGVLIGIAIKEKSDGKFKVSVRTNEPFDAAKICSAFGGGGHIRAAGCEFSCSAEQAKLAILNHVEGLLKAEE